MNNLYPKSLLLTESLEFNRVSYAVYENDRGKKFSCKSEVFDFKGRDWMAVNNWYEMEHID